MYTAGGKCASTDAAKPVMKGMRITKSIEFFFVILLILGLCISAAILMNAGRKSFSRIIENNNRLDDARIAVSYIGMRIRQNDTGGNVRFVNNAVEGCNAIELIHSGAEEGMATYIYCKDGELREIYFWSEDGPDPEFSDTVAKVDGLDAEFDEKAGYFTITVSYEEDGIEKHMKKVIGLMSGGGGDG